VAVASPDQYLADLNPAQREAVLTTEGPLLVIAGAGSGKTRVLTYRVAHLINAVGVKPNEILAITFTNKAAGEMRERLGLLLGNRARAIWILTFHAACGRILRREAQRLGYRSNFTIYDQADQHRLVKQCLEELERDPKRFTPHSHTEFEQISLELWGSYQHHLRYPWEPDSTTWRDDAHFTVKAPGITVMPVNVIHTSQAMEASNRLSDIFAPPRIDFTLAGNCYNNDEYPLPEGVTEKIKDTGQPAHEIYQAEATLGPRS